MTRPQPRTFDLHELMALALQVLAHDRFPCLATCDGDQPRLRPVSPVKTERFTVWIANLKSYRKTVEIAANPKVELCYVDATHNQVRITGIAEIITDRESLEAIWQSNPLLRQYLGTVDNPELIVYRVRPDRVLYMQEWALEYHEVPLEGGK
jgi:general stress protein 26